MPSNSRCAQRYGGTTSMASSRGAALAPFVSSPGHHRKEDYNGSKALRGALPLTIAANATTSITTTALPNAAQLSLGQQRLATELLQPPQGQQPTVNTLHDAAE